VPRPRPRRHRGRPGAPSATRSVRTARRGQDPADGGLRVDHGGDPSGGGVRPARAQCDLVDRSPRGPLRRIGDQHPDRLRRRQVLHLARRVGRVRSRPVHPLGSDCHSGVLDPGVRELQEVGAGDRRASIRASQTPITPTSANAGSAGSSPNLAARPNNSAPPVSTRAASVPPHRSGPGGASNAVPVSATPWSLRVSCLAMRCARLTACRWRTGRWTFGGMVRPSLPIASRIGTAAPGQRAASGAPGGAPVRIVSPVRRDAAPRRTGRLKPDHPRLRAVIPSDSRRAASAGSSGHGHKAPGTSNGWRPRGARS
jgi:hypothetical protein